MKNKLAIFGLGVFCLGISNAFAGTPVNLSQLKTNDWGFVQNKGQLLNAEGHALSSVKYYGQSSINGRQRVNLYCGADKIGFVFTRDINEPTAVSEATGKPELLDNQVKSSEQKTVVNRAELILSGGNKNAAIVASYSRPYYENFYGDNIPEKGINRVNSYKTITYKDIYPHIDMVLHANGCGIKYEFMVYPGGKVSDIRVHWNGLQNMAINNNYGIQYSLCEGVTMKESNPLSFQGSTKVPSSFLASNTNDPNTFGFRVSEYNRSKVLVIDPTLTWGTYFGGTGGATTALNVATDTAGNVYLSGATTSTAGIATTGAFQSTYGTNTDAFLAKFDKNGSLLWSTYYGLKGNERGRGLAVDPSGNVYVAGASTSQSSIATSGAYLTKNTAQEAFLVQFSSTGARNWGTYFGGGGELSVVVACDGIGDVYILGQTTSTKNIASSGAYQTSFGGGPSDMFLAKFISTGAYQWSSYFGGSGADVPGAIVADNTGNVFILGNSTSSKGIATSGAYQTTMNGGGTNGDAALAEFNTNGAIMWGTYYGGENDDQGLGITIDPYNNLYITGATNSYSSIATSGAYQTSNQGGQDAYLAKFSKKGALAWATYYGGSNKDDAMGVASDPNGNIYITGSTTSTSGIATTGSLQATLPSGDEAMFLIRFDKSGMPKYGTYYDFTDVAESLSVATSGYTNVYVAGNSSSTTGIATSGAFMTTLTGTEDAYLVKFDFAYNNDAGIVSITNPDTAACSGLNEIKVQLKNYGVAELDSVKINWSLNSKNQTAYEWKGKLKPDSATTVTISDFNLAVGSDTIKAWTSLPNGITDSIPINDSAKTIFKVHQSPAANAGKNVKACFGNTTDVIGATGISGNTYSWVSSPAGFTSTSSTATVSPSVTTAYILTETVTATGCAKTDTVTLTVNPLPKTDAGIDQTICQGTQINLGNTTKTTDTYQWSSLPVGFSSTVSDTSIIPLATTTYILTETNVNQCSQTDSVTITVNPLPVANAGTNATICSGSPVSLGAVAVSGSSYIWSQNPTGFTSTEANPSVSPTSSSVYILTEINSYGCSKTDSVSISTNPFSAANVGTDSVICMGVIDNLGANSVTGSSYVWSSFPTGFTSSLSNPAVSPITATTYILTETNIFGCKKTDSIVVKVNPLPAAVTGSDSVICHGASASLGSTAISGDTYKWASSPAGFSSTSSNVTVTPTASTKYYLIEMVAATGCAKIDSINVKVNPLPIADAGQNATVCSGTTVKIGGSAVNGDVYLWSSTPIGFTSTLANPFANPTITTTYKLKETNTFGCSSTDSVIVIAEPLPNARWIIDYYGNQAYLHAIDSSYSDTSYHWGFGDGDSSAGHSVMHLYAQNKDYTIGLRLTSANGCSNEFDTTVTITKSGIQPNSISQTVISLYPNPFQSSFTVSYSLKTSSKVSIGIYSTTGKLIGTVSDKMQPSGDYSILLDAEKYNIDKGIYLLRFMTDQDNITMPIVKF